MRLEFLSPFETFETRVCFSIFNFKVKNERSWK